MRIARLLGPILLVLAGCTSDAFLGSPAPQDHAAIFDQVWNEFDLHYSFFEMKHVDWNALRDRYRPIALAATTDSDFASVLGQMLAELKDVHVSLTPGNAATIRYVSQFEQASTYFNEATVFAHYVTELPAPDGGRVRYGLAAPTIGYIFIPSFEGSGWASEIDNALQALHGITGLIIDVRNDRGGSIQMAIDIAGRFTSRAQTYGYVRLRNGPGFADFTSYITETVVPAGTHFGGPVVVMANRHTFSSAEDFLLAMRVSPFVTIVGDTTAGASGSPIVRELPNGWTYQLSEWIEYTPARQTFEGLGLAPDVVATSSAANAAHGVDPAIEMALKVYFGTQPTR